MIEVFFGNDAAGIDAIMSLVGQFDPAAFYAKRDAITGATRGASRFSFGPFMLILGILIAAYNWWAAYRYRSEAERDLYDARLRFEKEQRDARDELHRLREELRNERHINAYHRAGAYVPAAEVGSEPSSADEVFSAKPVAKVATAPSPPPAQDAGDDEGAALGLV